MKYLIIGAGPVGLGTARVLKSRGIPYEQVEADREVGGNWLHGVYRTAYVLSCKQVMEFPEHPMPADYPDFPSQSQLSKYLIEYSHFYQLRENISFNKKVVWVEPVLNNNWKVCFENGTTEIYTGVLICNGHHWSKRYPKYPGELTCQYFHSKDYTGPEQLTGKKVLVIGAGNSGCDIACEAARVGTGSFLSMRRSVWIFPKSFMGKPLGQMQLPRMPRFIESALIRMLIRLTFGKHSQYNLPKPTYHFFDRHPTVSEELPYYLRHGRVKLKPDIKMFDGQIIHFVDGTSEKFDTVVAATGFNLDFPFLPDELVRKEKSHLKVFGYACYEDYKGLYFIGWQQVRGGVGSLVSRYAEVIANFIEVEEKTGQPMGSVLQSMGEKTPESHLIGSKEMFQWIKKMNVPRLMRYASKLKSLQNKNKMITTASSVKGQKIAVF